MKAEISHHGFAADHRVSGVYLQQGRMLTDRDWNALCDRLRSLIETTAAPLAGDGAPRRGGVMTEFGESDPTNHVWSASFADDGGLVIAEGTVGELAPADGGAPFSYDNQRDLPLPPPLVGAATLYVDVWDRIVTVFDDPDLADPALHGADTCFVSRRVAQVKQWPAGAPLDETACGLELPSDVPRIGDASFAISLRGTSAGADPCDPCAEMVDIEQPVANHLFRLEVHDVAHGSTGEAETLVLKWSRDNGAIQYDRPADFDHTRLDPDSAYEFFTDAMELQAGLPPGGYEERFERGTLAHEDLASVDPGLDRIRQWDGHCTIDLTGPALVDGWDRTMPLSTTLPGDTHGRVVLDGDTLTVDLEAVTVVLTLSGSRFLVGDHWLALSRSRAAEDERVRVLQPLPIGTRHRYCVLGEVDGDGRTFPTLDARDKRRLGFPPLACLTADDVGYDPAGCTYARDEKVTNVREALDAFCERLQAPYLTLRMNQGTGQQAAPGGLLPCAVSVLVEDQNGLPVEGVGVYFTVEETGADLVFERAEDADPNAEQPSVKVPTDGGGHALAWWWVAEPEGCHRLRAWLAGAPQGEAGEVWFAADVRRLVARDITYDPGCAYLSEKGADDVGEALDLLCAAIPTQQELPRITSISWENDENLTLSDFVDKGLRVEFTEETLMIDLVSPDVFIVTLEVPESPVPGVGRLGFRPLIVGGDVVPDGKAACVFVPSWTSSTALDDWLADAIAALGALGDSKLPGLRCRVRLLGGMVLSDKGAGVLDGFVPGLARKDGTIDLDFTKAGLGHLSNFESWFYLVLEDAGRRPPVDINRATLEQLTTLPNVSPEIARAIIELRPYGEVDELTRVPGIGPARLEALRPLVRV